MALQSIFPENELSAHQIVKAFYPQRRFDYSTAFRELNLFTAFGVTLNGTREGKDKIDVSKHLYLGWKAPNPEKGFVVFWSYDLDNLVGYNVDIGSRVIGDVFRCEVCQVQRRGSLIAPVTFRIRENVDHSIMYRMCAALDCSSHTTERDFGRGYEILAPTPELISARENHVFTVLHSIYERLGQPSLIDEG